MRSLHSQHAAEMAKRLDLGGNIASGSSTALKEAVLLLVSPVRRSYRKLRGKKSSHSTSTPFPVRLAIAPQQIIY